MPARRSNGGVFGAGSLGFSLSLHALVFLSIWFMRSNAPRITAPVYRVDLVAAPAGPRQAGVVRQNEKPAPEPEPTPPPPRPEKQVEKMPPPPTKAPPQRKATPPATQTTQPPAKTTTQATTAGGGETGGRGTDVANVRTEGIEFPFPGYLENIVRQIAQRFSPGTDAALRAEVKFLIRRDGSAEIVEFVTRSGNYGFDLEARGAIEAVARVKGFGPLPDAYPNDVLTVVFSFDPRTIR